MIRQIATTCVVCALGAPALANSPCGANDPLTIISATDDGLYDDIYGPHNVIDGVVDPDSRWSNESIGSPKSILLDLGARADFERASDCLVQRQRTDHTV